jgi:putative inorganic carbon (hco3(-)) transporter
MDISYSKTNGTVTLVVASLSALLAVSVLYTPIPLALVLGIAFSFYFVSRPYELLLAMVFLIPFNFIFMIGPLPLAFELLKVFAWIPFLNDFFSGRRLSFTASRYNRWFAIVTILLLLSIPRSLDLPFTVKDIVRLGSNLGLVYLVVNLVDTRERLFQVFRVLAFSTFLVACYGFYQWAIQDFGSLFWIVNPRLETNLAHYRDTFWEWRNRIISTLSSELELGHYFNSCLPIGVLLWVKNSRMRLMSPWLLMTLASLLGLFLTFTFGAWLSLAATAGLFLLLLEKKRRWQTLLAFVLVVALFLALAMGPLGGVLMPKLMTTGQGSFAWDVFTRLDLWSFGFQMWLAHPFFGVGVGNFDSLAAGRNPLWSDLGVGPHNTYVYLLVDLGILGLTSILAIIVGNIRTNLKLRTDPYLGLAGVALAFALTTNLFGWMTDDSVFFAPHAGYLLWLLVGLSEAVANLSRQNGIATLDATPICR